MQLYVNELYNKESPNVKFKVFAIAQTKNHDARCFRQSNDWRLIHVLRQNHTLGCQRTRRWLAV